MHPRLDASIYITASVISVDGLDKMVVEQGNSRVEPSLSGLKVEFPYEMSRVDFLFSRGMCRDPRLRCLVSVYSGNSQGTESMPQCHGEAPMIDMNA